MVCYNFMAGLGWYRTKVDVPERGGALVSEFNLTRCRRQGSDSNGARSAKRRCGRTWSTS